MINTSGYQTRAMPVFSPVNPSLVAFNPNVAADGMMQAFQLAKQYEDIKSKKALQAELEATRQARIAQTNALANFDVARTGAETPTLMPKAGLQLAEIENKLALMPQERAARESDLLFNTEKNRAFMPNLELLAKSEKDKTNAGLRALEPVTNATIDKAVAESAQSKIDADTSYQRGKVTSKKLDLDFEEVSDRLLHAKDDNARARAAKDIDTLLKNSQIIENMARADYYSAGGGKSGTKPNIANQIAALQLAKQRLETAPYTLPGGDQVKGLSAYRGAVYDDKGNVRKSFWTNTPARRDDNAEDAIKTSAAIDKAINNLLPHFLSEMSGGGVLQEEAGKVDVSKIPQAHVNYLKANPKFKSDFDAKYGKGAADQILK